MSAPNKSYDPVEVEALKPEEIERMRDEALAAFAAAGDLDALQAGQGRAHRRPLAAGAGQPRDRRAAARTPRPTAGKRVGQARGAVNKALAARQARAGGRARRPRAGRGGRRRHAARTTASRAAPGTR